MQFHTSAIVAIIIPIFEYIPFKRIHIILSSFGMVAAFILSSFIFKLLSLFQIGKRDYTEFYKSSLSSAYSCGNVQTSPINYYNWETLECGGGRENIKNYIAIQNNRLYLLAVSYQDESLLEAKEIMNHIEKNLRFSNTVA